MSDLRGLSHITQTPRGARDFKILTRGSCTDVILQRIVLGFLSFPHVEALVLPFINFVYVVSFKFKLKAKLQNCNSSIIFICHNHNCALVITCTGIAALSSILQQLSFCGYNIILAAIASPVHTCPLLLIYLSGTFFFVILLAILLKSFHKYGCKAKVCSVTMLIAIVIAIFAHILYLFFVITVKPLKGRHLGGSSVVNFFFFLRGFAYLGGYHGGHAHNK